MCSYCKKENPRCVSHQGYSWLVLKVLLYHAWDLEGMVLFFPCSVLIVTEAYPMLSETK